MSDFSRDDHNYLSARERKSDEIGYDRPPVADSSANLEAPAVVDDQPNYTVFTKWEKRGIVMGAAAGAFFSPLTAQIYFPALNLLATDFNVSITQINLTVTTYMIFQGITPMFIGSFADSTGRRPAYLICFIIYIAANIGCALAPNYVALLILRMVQSAGSSTTVALCQAVVGDTITSAERGNYVGFTAVPIILAPALGPVVGGLISQFLGWRWIFWLLTILAGVVCILYAFFMPETCRNIVGNGSIRPHPFYRSFWQLTKDGLRVRRARKNPTDLALHPATSQVSTKHRLRLRPPNPLRSLQILFELEMFLLLGYGSIIFAGFYAIATAMPAQLADGYGYDELTIGLMYLPLSGGAVVAAVVVGKLMSWNYRRHCKKLGVPFDRSKQQNMTGFPIEKARLEFGIMFLAFSILIILPWGWAIQYHAHVAVLCVLLFLLGFGMIGLSNMATTLIVDLNPGHAGAAIASNNLARCLVGAAASAVIAPMIKGIGSGWSFIIFGVLYLSGMPVLWIIMHNGVRWRKEKEDRRRAKK
ncbi:major facilitator superfamily transporter [Pseudomassariella vexata]|uniref:Major facilitator superfamily transporter n=1 Tax=Pseudomassariella vexata TaxID=1141098 RepID=A0A1Y2DKP0_9PEZI|nr:major facilitator superfamily transporter [Pseudomassariella vexata]ORY59749.1 major facilitator superfamily transporter [Pseudomassariella vexata]